MKCQILKKIFDFETYFLTEGSVTISHIQSPAKGPQAMRYPNAVVAIIFKTFVDKYVK